MILLQQGKGAEMGAKEFVIGMADRGRLNVLANILNKSYEEIFAEFEGKSFQKAIFEGDVKYHMGYSSDQLSDGGKNVHISLTPNPSHLEIISSTENSRRGNQSKIDMPISVSIKNLYKNGTKQIDIAKKIFNV